MSSSENFQFEYLAQNQDNIQYSINSNIFLIDILLTRTVKSTSTFDPPLEPQNGDIYIIPVDAFGIWQKFPNQLAIYDINNGWFFLKSKEGIEFYVLDIKEKVIFKDEKWQKLSTSQNTNIDESSFTKIQSDWNQVNINQIDFIKNKPNIPTKISNLINDSFSNIDNTSDLDKPVSNSSQLELNLKANSNDVLYKSNNLLELTNKDRALENIGGLKKNENLYDLPDKSIARENLDVYSKTQINSSLEFKANSNDVLYKSNNLLELTDKDRAKNNLGLSTVATTGDYNDLINKPSFLVSNGGSEFLTGDYKQSAQNANHGKWLLCNGVAVSRSVYSSLFALIGVSFGNGDGNTTFNLPDFRGRIFGSIGQGDGLTNRTPGQKIGAETHQLIISEIPSHNHSFVQNVSYGGVFYPNNMNAIPQGVNGFASQLNTSLIQNNGGNQPHNNMQPTLFAGNIFIYS